MAVGVSSTGDSKGPACIVEQPLEGSNFSAVPVGSQTLGGCVLKGVQEGWGKEWFFTHMPAEEADCMLVALGLLHMRVKCMIPKELGGN